MKVDQKERTSEALTQQMSAMGVALRGHRILRRLTQEDIADQGNFSRQTVSRIEKGDPSVAWGQVARYAEIVGAKKFFVLPTPTAEDPAARRVRRTSVEKAVNAS